VRKTTHPNHERAQRSFRLKSRGNPDEEDFARVCGALAEVGNAQASLLARLII